MKRCFTLRPWLLALLSLASAAQGQIPVDLGTVQVPHMGHVFLTQSPPFPNLVMDYFIDQSQQSGGGVLAEVTVDWNTNHVFVLTVVPPPGDMFLVQPSAVRGGKFSGVLLWTNGLQGFSPRGAVTVGISNLQGVLPDFSQSFSSLNYSQSAFGFGNVDSAPFTKEIAFTSLVITGTATPQLGDGGALTFTPDAASSLAFISATSKSSDPGPCVSIVPFNYRAQSPLDIAPVINFTNDEAGNFAVTYLGTLQSSSDPGGPFTDVPGHPLAAFAVPKGGQNPQQFFRTRYTH